MQRYKQIQFIWYPGSKQSHRGCDIFSNGLHTVIPERLQSSFGLLRMSHLLLQVSFLPLMFSRPLCILASFTFFPLFLFLNTVHIGCGLAWLIIMAWTREQGRRIEGVSTLKHGLSVMILPANYLSAASVTPPHPTPPPPSPKNRLNTREWPALDFMLHWTLNKLEEGHPRTANCKKHMVY